MQEIMQKEQDKNLDELLYAEEPTPTFSMNPRKFMLWLFIVSIVMIFASLTSAYIVKQADGNWLYIQLPDILWYSTAVILLSSLSMQLAYRAAQKEAHSQSIAYLVVTLVLGVAFLLMQWYGWVDLVNRGIFFGGVDYDGNPANPAGSFLYVLMGVHAFHLITGLVFLAIVLFQSFRLTAPNRMLNFEIATIYWHFLDGLWVYLFLFLLLNR